ncbi:Sporulation-specific N-acetylmuramoyl-L-alanine amidase [Meiothermus luteus]|jgi:N-acetylmuramoyl-L-alanine amidase|uniref:Sporulation-specific N-acetylmuramoyl-L-alanine amidase n=1 Tax=Meiothermus luteus TaxID=2026184 RepID=A0A399EZR6_9DEIN|nr:N-acetylmuramoyl-L-alanine amidase [Meiothermus luteus]RIH87821.1 Sporulation-specific N-acetylmuramoyl-L-alanine amidase [Meiothermus luteus]RMH54920.1 MAG: N-acetylmuramoyl-L-alanine amidase [Deinococcota bacterium]
MRRALVLALFVLGLGSAQYENLLRVGAQEAQVIRPGGAEAYGQARRIADALGLGYLETPDRLYLSLGSRVAAFEVTAQEAEAARSAVAYRYQGGLWVPVQELARRLDLYYRTDYGASVLALRPARLLSVERAALEGVERYILRFDREVQARLLPGSPPRVALIGVQEVPDAPPGAPVSFSQEEWGSEVYLPQGDGPLRLFFLPRQVVVERGEGRRAARVVVDAGHGGSDAGVRVGELREKDLTLSLALRLRRLLQARGLEVALTREADREVPLLARAQYASTAQVFLSLHAAAGRQTTVYTHPEIQTLRLLERGRELLARTSGGQRELLERYVAPPGASARLAQAISGGFAARGVVAQVSQDAMYVLSLAGGAAVLVEVGFEQLRTAQGRDQAAAVLAQAVFSYLGLGGNRP